MPETCEWCHVRVATLCVGCHHHCCDDCLSQCNGCPVCGQLNLPYCEDCGLLPPLEPGERLNWSTQPMLDPEWGSCCICEIVGPAVRNGLMLAHQGAIPGRGWGCLACGLPPVGVVAVVCDECLALYARDPSRLRFFCAGHPGEDGRREIADLNPVPFEHDLTNHPELQD